MGKIGAKLMILIFSWFFHYTLVIKLPHFCPNEVQNPKRGNQSQKYCCKQKINSIGAKLTILSTRVLAVPPSNGQMSKPNPKVVSSQRSLHAKNQPTMSKTVENAPKWLLSAFF